MKHTVKHLGVFCRQGPANTLLFLPLKYFVNAANEWERPIVMRHSRMAPACDLKPSCDSHRVRIRIGWNNLALFMHMWHSQRSSDDKYADAEQLRSVC